MNDHSVSEEVRKAIQPLFEYLCVEDEPEQSDVIFVFGSTRMPAVWKKAADLFKEGYAPKVLVTGGANHKLNGATEAEYIQDELMVLGVPRTAIILESHASNTLENVTLGMAALKAENIWPRKILLVAKPPHMRRCIATFQQQFPDVVVFSCPPKMDDELINHLVIADILRATAEVDRLRTYAVKGDLRSQDIPRQVDQAIQKVKKLVV